MESAITQPLEDSLSGIEGIKTIKSQSREEVSQITITFVAAREIDGAANDVRDRVARIRKNLPAASDNSVVSKIEADAQPILWIALSSDRHTPMEMSDYADRYLTDPLKALPGVASVIIGGERKYAMRVWLDRERLAAQGLTAQDVEDALNRENLDSPSGRIESTQREFTVQARTDLRSPEEFNNMIIKEVNGYPVRLKDVGRAAPGPYENRKIVRVRGEEALGLGVVKQSTANTLEVAQAAKALLPRLQAPLQPGMKMWVAVDTSKFIEASIHSVFETIFVALVLVVLVIFFFLREVRATLIPAVTIPISIIGHFTFLKALGFSINTLTLLGVVLSIGLVVDDAIVVLENVHRHIEDGMKPFKAALVGSKEIGFAVIAMTITLAAVFTPLSFAQGNTGKLMTEFALTVATSVIVSGFVALSLVPMMCSKLLRHEHSWVYRKTEPFFEGMTDGYRAALSATLRHRWVVGVAFLAVLGVMVWLFTQLKAELSPEEDRSLFLAFVIAPEGSSMQYTDSYMHAVEDIAKGIPEIDTMFAVVAPGLERPNPVNLGIAFAVLKPWDERKRSQQQITKELGPKLYGGLPGALSFTKGSASAGTAPVLQEGRVRHLRQHLRGIAGQGQQDDGEAQPVSGHHRPGHRSQAEQAAVRRQDRPRQGRSAGHLHGGDRSYAGDAARRVRRHALQARGQAVRRRRADGGRQAAPAERSHLDLRARRGWFTQSALEPGDSVRDGRAEGAEPLQQTARGDHQRRAGGQYHPGRRCSITSTVWSRRSWAPRPAPTSTTFRASSGSRADSCG